MGSNLQKESKSFTLFTFKTKNVKFMTANQKLGFYYGLDINYLLSQVSQH